MTTSEARPSAWLVLFRAPEPKTGAGFRRCTEDSRGKPAPFLRGAKAGAFGMSGNRPHGLWKSFARHSCFSGEHGRTCATDFRISTWRVRFGEVSGEMMSLLGFAVGQAGNYPKGRCWNDGEVGSSGPEGAADCGIAPAGLRQLGYRKAVKDGAENGQGAF